MFDIGFSELLMTALVGLLVIGPQRLPEVARFLGFWLGRFRHIAANARAEFEHELQIQEMRDLFSEQSGLQEVKQLGEEMSATTEAIKQSLSGEEIYAMYHQRKAELQELVKTENPSATHSQITEQTTPPNNNETNPPL